MMLRAGGCSVLLGACGLACAFLCFLSLPASGNGYVGIYLGVGDSTATFVEAGHFEVGESPQTMMLADLDDDGDLDVVVTNWGSDDVSILLGNGDGTLGDTHMTPAGLGPMGLDVGDTDGDGVLDLVVTNPRVNNVALVPGVGDGSFGVPTFLHTGNEPWAVGIGDFNHDDRADLAVSNWEDGFISVLLGLGDEEFAEVDLLEGLDSRVLRVADINGDGIDDIVATHWIWGAVFCAGVGDGSFAEPEVYSTGLGPNDLALGDLDGDGIDDLAVTNEYTQDVSLFTISGSGSFTERDSLEVAGSPRAIAVEDLDGDGFADLVVASGAEGRLEVFWGNGGGSFGRPLVLETGYNPRDVRIGDLNGDGVEDLAVLTYGVPPSQLAEEPEKPQPVREVSIAVGPIYPKGNGSVYSSDGGGLNLRLVPAYQPAPGLFFWSSLGANLFRSGGSTVHVPVPEGPVLEVERTTAESNAALHVGLQIANPSRRAFFRPRIGFAPGIYFFWTELNFIGEGLESYNIQDSQFRFGWRGSIGADFYVTRKLGICVEYIYDWVVDLDQGIEGQFIPDGGAFVSWNIGMTFAVGR